MLSKWDVFVRPASGVVLGLSRLNEHFGVDIEGAVRCSYQLPIPRGWRDMRAYLANRREPILRNLGYLFIWGDIWRLFAAVHAFFVGPIDLESHLSAYLMVFIHLMEWVSSLSSFHDALVQFLYGLPAVVAYLLSYTVSTAIGVWLVRKSRHNV